MLNEFVRVEGQNGLKQMFSLRHEFGTEWTRFLNTLTGVKRSVTMPLTKERFPFLFQGRPIAIKEIELFVKVNSVITTRTRSDLRSRPAKPHRRATEFRQLEWFGAWN